jgi:hypothetical protein
MRRPRAYLRALARFEGGYGDPPNLSDAGDVDDLVRLLEDEIRRDVEQELVDAVERRTARLEAAS